MMSDAYTPFSKNSPLAVCLIDITTPKFWLSYPLLHTLGNSLLEDRKIDTLPITIAPIKLGMLDTNPPYTVHHFTLLS